MYVVSKQHLFFVVVVFLVPLSFVFYVATWCLWFAVECPRNAVISPLVGLSVCFKMLSSCGDVLQLFVFSPLWLGTKHFQAVTRTD